MSRPGPGIPGAGGSSRTRRSRGCARATCAGSPARGAARSRPCGGRPVSPIDFRSGSDPVVPPASPREDRVPVRRPRPRDRARGGRPRSRRDVGRRTRSRTHQRRANPPASWNPCSRTHHGSAGETASLRQRHPLPGRGRLRAPPPAVGTRRSRSRSVPRPPECRRGSRRPRPPRRPRRSRERRRSF